MRICIGGGGLAGLSLAYFLKGVSDVVLIEANSRVGGLLKSEAISNFMFDAGGAHVIFSRNNDILSFIVDIIGRVVKHRRDARIYYNGRFIKYPFENGIYMLDPEERFEILVDFIDNLVRREKNELKKPENLEEWFYYVFGKAISKKYLIPYNLKIWKRSLRNISLEWVGDRVPNPPVTDILKGIVGIPTEGYLHQLNFYYPESGGIEALAKSFLKKVQGTIATNMEITSIKVRNKEFIVETNNKSIECSMFINTIPLPELIKTFSNASEYVLKLTKRLSYNSLIVVGVGLKNSFKPYHWIYFPQREVTFHRVAVISNFTLPNISKKHVSVVFETSVLPNSKLWRLNDKEIAERILSEAEEVELLSRENVETVKVWRWKYAYIVYDKEYSKIIGEVINYLNEFGLHTTGRFGLWRYLNMDQVVLESKKIALKILGEQV